MILEGVCEYEWLESFKQRRTEEALAVIDRAVSYYRGYVDFESEEELAVIRVDKCYCIIKCYDFYTPCEFVEQVAPFDIERSAVYPIQGVKVKLDWVY